LPPKLKVQPDALEARDGVIAESDNPTNNIRWKNACALLGPNPITKRGNNVPNDSQKAHLISRASAACRWPTFSRSEIDDQSRS